MIQSFSKGNSTETRLIPIRDASTGKYYDINYDNENYESVMFYHNSVVREKAQYLYDMSSDGKINEISGLDNHYDSINFLYVLDMYKRSGGEKEFQIPTIELANTICDELGSYRKRPTTIASLREKNRIRRSTFSSELGTQKEFDIELLKEKFPKGMIQCYTSSKRMQKFAQSFLQCPNAHLVKLNTSESLIDLLRKDNSFVNVELSLFTTKKYSDSEKTGMLQKHGIFNTNIGNFLANWKHSRSTSEGRSGAGAYAWKNFRLFVHAWNVYKIKESYYIASSWYNIRDYEITHEFKNKEEYLLFLDNLEKSINNFGKQPKVLYELFGLNQTTLNSSGITKLFPIITELTNVRTTGRITAGSKVLEQPFVIEANVAYI
jgi:hypothetical protein